MTIKSFIYLRIYGTVLFCDILWYKHCTENPYHSKLYHVYKWGCRAPLFSKQNRSGLWITIEAGEGSTAGLSGALFNISNIRSHFGWKFNLSWLFHVHSGYSLCNTYWTVHHISPPIYSKGAIIHSFNRCIDFFPLWSATSNGTRCLVWLSFAID